MTKNLGSEKEVQKIMKWAGRPITYLMTVPEDKQGKGRQEGKKGEAGGERRGRRVEVKAEGKLEVGKGRREG